MIDIPEFRRLWRVKPFDFWIALAAVIGVLSVGVLLGVVVGIALSLLWLINVTTRPSMPLLGRETGTQVYRDLGEYPDDETYPGIAVIRSTVACSSPPPRRSTSASARSSRTSPVCIPSSSTSRASTSSTLKGPRSRRARRGDHCERGRAAPGAGEARRVRSAGAGRAHRSNRPGLFPRKRPSGRRGHEARAILAVIGHEAELTDWPACRLSDVDSAGLQQSPNALNSVPTAPAGLYHLPSPPVRSSLPGRWQHVGDRLR